MADISKIKLGNVARDIKDAVARNALALKENLSNKVTAWSSTTTNDHYPSEKLVKDNLDLKMEMDLLWENSSPGSSFAAQTISCDISPYEGVLVLFVVSYNAIPENWDIADFCPRNRTNQAAASAQRLSQPEQGGDTYYVCRTYYTSSAGIVFNDGFWKYMSTGATKSNTWMVPFRIYGIKKGA